MTAFCRAGSYAKYCELIPINVDLLLDHLGILLLYLCFRLAGTNFYLIRKLTLCIVCKIPQRTIRVFFLYFLSTIGPFLQRPIEISF